MKTYTIKEILNDGTAMVLLCVNGKELVERIPYDQATTEAQFTEIVKPFMDKFEADLAAATPQSSPLDQIVNQQITL